MAAARALLLLAAAALAAALGSEDVSSGVTVAESADLDEESDSAAFMVVVEHEDGWRCSASLVSQRTAVTTARCALGRRAAPRELWALASALLAARPPAPPAAAARRVRRLALAAAAPPALELAVLELEAPFGARARARPILLAASRGECERARRCNAVRALTARPRRPARRVRLRVVDVRRAAAERCAARVPAWPPAPADRLVCYEGDELCEVDLGGGVVCDGKLCSVLGDTAGAAADDAAGGAARCSDTYATLAVAQWRRFLHCAHTLRLCGRGDCAKLCTERRLIPEEDGDNDTYIYRTPVRNWNTQLEVTRSSSMSSREPRPEGSAAPTRTSSAAASRPPAPAASRSAAPPAAAAGTLGTSAVFTVTDAITRPPAAVFEPNRADFKVGQSQSTLVRLKAGEYGDNAADYDGDEPPPPTRTSAAPPALAAAPALAADDAAADAALAPDATRTPPALERRESPLTRSEAQSINTLCKFNIAYLILMFMM
ncbi:uncharacterized protein [Epargyreus clarus]|uniref:uncharacterized protein n=1 Tax=Epargyreus clarus TaxID=520877 RepID=UPI003C2E63D8